MVYGGVGVSSPAHIDFSLLTSPTAYYDPLNFSSSLLTGSIVYLVIIGVLYYFFKFSREEWRKALMVTVMFVIIDYVLHTSIEGFAVPMPLYAISKVFFTLPFLLIVGRFLKNTTIISALLAVFLETRYVVLYAGRSVFGIPFSIFNGGIHFLILIISFWAYKNYSK